MENRNPWKLYDVKKGCLKKSLNRLFCFRKDNDDNIYKLDIDTYPDLSVSPIQGTSVDFDKHTPKTSSKISSISHVSVKNISPSKLLSPKKTISQRVQLDVEKNRCFDDENWIIDNPKKRKSIK